MKRRNVFILLISFILIPQTLLANAGTALMWIPIMQLVFGNILIGIVEGILISILYKTKLIRSVLIMIGGNYVSWFFGNGFIYFFQNTLIDSLMKLDKVFVLWILSMIILFIVTVLVELPFVRWSFKKNDRIWSRSWRLSLGLNSITYLLMIFLYLSASKYSFFTELKIDQTLLKNKSQYELIYIYKDEVYKGIIKEKIAAEKIFKLPSEIDYPHFFLEEDSVAGILNLYVEGYQSNSILLQNAFIESSKKSYYPKLTNDYRRITLADFREKQNREWKTTTGNWSIDGLTITEGDKIKQNFAFEVPWMFWSIHQVTILNNCELVCIINNRIVILNRDTKKVAFVVKGTDYIIRKL